MSNPPILQVTRHVDTNLRAHDVRLVSDTQSVRLGDRSSQQKVCYTFKRCTFLNRTCIASNSPNCIGRDLALSMSLMCNPPTFVTRHVDANALVVSKETIPTV